MKIIVQPEYKLTSGQITYFESYMQITTPKHQKRYKNYYGSCFLIDESGELQNSMQNLETRKKLVTLFNLEAKEVLNVDRLPKANKFGTNIIYFESENDQENNLTSVYKAIDMIIPALHDFCAKYKTICLVSSHIEEYTPDLTEIDEPHIHILFVKTSNIRGYDKLTDFLTE